MLKAEADYDAFERRCCELFDRIDAGEKVSLADAADYVGMPIADFVDTYNLLMSMERRRKMN